MKSLLFTKFQQLNLYLSEGNLPQAEVLLNDLLSEGLPISARKLFDSLNEKYRRLSGTNLQFERTISHPTITPVTPDGVLSSYDDRALLDGISLVSCCMNRNSNLSESLKSWLKLPVQEIVIVDWNSTEPVASTLSGLQDPRIKIIRVEDESKWILTYGFNVGLRFSSFTKIYKLDADIQVATDFIEHNSFGEHEFIRGNWKSAVDRQEDDQKYVNGSFGAYKKDLLDVGFYNEFIRSYGWDDSDLYIRLAYVQGLRRKYLAYDSLLHLEQEQEERLKHQDVCKKDFIDRFPATEFANATNKFTTALFDKWDKDLLQDYSITRLDEQLWSCKRTTKHQIIPDAIHRDAERHAVIELTSWVSAVWAQKIYKEPWIADFIYKQYTNEVPFQETSSILLFEDDFDVYFCESRNPYNVIKAIQRKTPKKGSSIAKQLFIFAGINKRFEAGSGPDRIIVHSLEDKLFDTVENLHRNQDCLRTLPDPGTSLAAPEPGVDDQLQRVLAISLYDEDNNNRVGEYLECISRNLKHFDVITVFYEKSSGLVYDLVCDTVNSDKSKLKANLVWIPIPKRPTFEEMFTAVDFIFPGSIACITNADIAFDETINLVSQTITENSFFVLSRKEVNSETADSEGLVMNCFGMPNTLSADSWIYLTPRKNKFRAEFGIGTFHCDSFLNYHIHESGYELYNPCLSVNVFHIHDPAFNSSESKKSELANQIDEVLIQETALCGGVTPIRGVQWCRIEDTAKPGRSGQLLEWSNSVINIEIDNEGNSFYASLVVAIMCLKIVNHINGSVNISLNYCRESLNNDLGDLLFDTVDIIGNPNLNIAVTNSLNSKPLSATSRAHTSSRPDVRNLVSTYLACHGESDDNSLFGTELHFRNVGGQIATSTDPYILAAFDKEQFNDLSTYVLVKSLKTEERALLLRIVASLSQKNPVLQPILDELGVASNKPENSNQAILFNSLWNPSPSERPASYDISFITSIFRGEKYFRGFLENIAASALECNGEVILVDAKSPENEKEIYEDFMSEFPGLKERFSYISLDEDPGLYNCWKLAIEQSSSDLVSNANLDDRRSPWQSKALIKSLKDNIRIGGAATAIRATKSENAAWYDLTENQVWFNHEESNIIRFESLYLSDKNDNVRSKNIMHCMPVWRKSLHSQHGYFDEKRYGTSADWAFWLECTKNGEEFELVPSALSMYFINESSHNRVNDIEGNKELTIIKDYLRDDQQTFIQQ